MLTAGQAVRCGQDTDHCHFIIYRRGCTVSGAQLISGVRLFAILWTVACQASLSVEFSKQEYRSGLLFSPSSDLPAAGIEPSSQFAGRFFTAELLGKPNLQTQLLKCRVQQLQQFYGVGRCRHHLHLGRIHTHLKVSTAFLPDILESCTLGAGHLSTGGSIA